MREQQFECRRFDLDDQRRECRERRDQHVRDVERPVRVAETATARVHREGEEWRVRVEGPASIAIKPLHSPIGPYVPAPLHRSGLPKDRGVYVIDPVLSKPGVYTATVKIDGSAVQLAFQVQAKPVVPTVGDQAPTAASPTFAKPLGVKPICTRTPMCPLHKLSLADLIGKGRPVAVIFATPALCQSQYCGPILDTLLPFATRYAEQIDFVHVEIYRDLTGTTVSPTVDAWNLSSEPWLFAVNPEGKIVDRLDGAFASDEIDALLHQILPA